MDIRFLYKGKTCLKNIHLSSNGERKTIHHAFVVCFVGIDKQGQLGIGYFSTSPSLQYPIVEFSGGVMRTSLIRLWRSTKFFEEVQDIDSLTLPACYRAVAPVLRNRGTFIEHLSRSMGEIPFGKVRQDVLRCYPHPKDSHRMLHEVKELRLSFEEDVLEN